MTEYLWLLLLNCHIVGSIVLRTGGDWFPSGHNMRSPLLALLATPPWHLDGQNSFNLVVHLIYLVANLLLLLPTHLLRHLPDKASKPGKFSSQSPASGHWHRPAPPPAGETAGEERNPCHDLSHHLNPSLPLLLLMLLHPPSSDAPLLRLLPALLLLPPAALLHQPLLTLLHWLSVTLGLVAGPALAHLHLPVDHFLHLFHRCSAILENPETNLPIHHDWSFGYLLFLLLLLFLLHMEFVQKMRKNVPLGPLLGQFGVELGG